jgi:hypothetical protein
VEREKIALKQLRQGELLTSQTYTGRFRPVCRKKNYLGGSQERVYSGVSAVRCHPHDRGGGICASESIKDWD